MPACRFLATRPGGSDADRYVLQLNFRLPEPIRMLVPACPLAYDATRSSNRGFGGVLGV
ncbi:MAG: hypothetical protein JWR24_685 [Actinoallomurus sp.]|jgi:hypothetical protein|nr:hypothetical protein [Actinoallomurus sp.]